RKHLTPAFVSSILRLMTSAVPHEASRQEPTLVPSELLQVPARAEARRIDRWACAPLLDGWLRRLARQESVCRRVVGQLAAFLRRRGHQRLGFARLGDYTRERLGLGARAVQGLAPGGPPRRPQSAPPPRLGCGR